MIARAFGSSWLRRLVVGLAIGAFLPVASAAVACQVHCAGRQPAHGPEDAAVSQRAAGSGMQRLYAYLTHAGPCHLTAVPGVAAAPRDRSHLALAFGWQPACAEAFMSLDWPPPEHRPRG